MVYVAGIDIGSAFSKAVVMAEGKIISYQVMPSGGDYRLAAEQVAEAALAKAKLSLKDLAYTVATGYGAANVSFSNQVTSDISCQGRGIFYLFPSARTVIDIGGQFTRVFRVDERGRSTAFLQSEKCAAGSGRFLNVIANVLRIDLKDIGPLSLKSKNPVTFTTGCAVFGESEAISRVSEGASKEDILAGVHKALANKISTLVDRVGLEKDCAVSGGGALNLGLIKSVEEKLGVPLLVPPHPQFITALGAAIIAEERQKT